MLELQLYACFLISLWCRAPLKLSTILVSNHMHTYDRIKLDVCSLATRVRLYHPAFLLLQLSTYEMIWNCKPIYALIRRQYGREGGGRCKG